MTPAAPPAAKDSPWEAGGSLSGVLSDQYQKVFNGMQERHQQSRAMPQIVIEQEPMQRRVG